MMRYVAGIAAALAVAAAATAGVARAATAPAVQWCGTGVSTADLADAVAGPQIHVIYAIPSDGVDRFPLISTGISTDLTAGVSWWQRQDFSRAPRFDLAAFPCFPSLGALDISDVRLPHDSSYYSGSAALFDAISGDLVAAGFQNVHKKYLVYYDSPSPLPPGTCGRGAENTTNGGADGYAEVYLAPNLKSEPTEIGCGNIESPDDRGGYSAIVAVHELIHTFGALDTTHTPGPPHACPGDANAHAHACDNPLDIMYSGGGQYWLDNRYLDYGNDDYYGMPVSDTWWDVQDSIWLRHLNEPTYTLDLTAGVGAASTTSDLPGVDCRGSAHCVSTWDANTAVMLTAAPANGYARVQWGGACASAGSSPDCTLTMSANQKVTVSYTRQLAVASFAAPRQTGTRLQARLTLSRRPLAGEARLACRATPGLKLVSHAIAGTVATCVWSIPKRLRGRRVSGRVTVNTDSGASLGGGFALKLR
jgi:hypothetical protein